MNPICGNPVKRADLNQLISSTTQFAPSWANHMS